MQKQTFIVIILFNKISYKRNIGKNTIQISI